MHTSAPASSGTTVTPDERAALLLAWDAHHHVSATRPDGTTSTWAALGGASCDHYSAAADVAGLGGVVRVLPVDLVV